MFFLQARYFPTQPIVAKLHFRGTQITIILGGHFLYLVYLCLCPRLNLLMSYLCDLFFNHIIFLKKTHLFFLYNFWSVANHCFFSLASRHTTSFQRLYDVYTKSLTSYRRRIDVETTSCVHWGY